MAIKIKLGNRWVGEGKPCFIIVDVGANHNRDFSIARRLIDEAAAAGADAIKFQVYSAEKLYSRNVPRHSRFKKDLWQTIKEIELPPAWIPKLKSHCNKKRINFFATPFDPEAADQLEPYVDFYKIASFELVHLPLIRHVARKKKPIIISTGLATMEEIDDAFSVCLAEGNDKVIFLQCASVYPAKPELMNLSAMATLSNKFGVLTGLSDHTPGTHVSVAGAAMGARVIEKHFTLDRKMKGPDHGFAVEPEELKEMVRQIREAESAFGDGKKAGPRRGELENFRIGRCSVHAGKMIPKGQRVDESMLVIKRPGFGIKPKYMNLIIGKRARRQIEKDEWITWKLIGRQI